MSVEWSWQRAADALPLLIDGFTITLLATVLGMAIASVLGLVIAVTRRTCPAYVRVPLRWITEFIRLTPARRPTPVRVLLASAIFRAADRYRGSGCPLFDVYGRGVPRRNRSGSRRTMGGCASPVSSDDENVASCGSSAGGTRHPTGAGKLRDFHVQGHTVPLRHHGGRIGHRCTAIRSKNLSISGADHDAGMIFLLASYPPTSVLIRQVEKRLAY